MAIALVTHVAAGSTDNANVTTGAVDTSGANLIVLFTGSASGTTPTDSKINTWTHVRQQTGSFVGHVDAWYCIAPTVGAGHTFSLADTSPVISAEAFSGIKASSPLDQQNGSDNNNGGPFNAGSITPSADNSVVLSSIGAFMNGSTSTVDFGSGAGAPTDFVQGVGGQNWGLASGYVIQGTAAAINPSWTQNGGFLVAAITLNFLAATGGGSRGLFQPSPLSGLGSGGSGYFRDPLGAPLLAPQNFVKRDRIYIPERYAA